MRGGSIKGTEGAAVNQVAFCPKRNLIAWTDSDGGFSRWLNPIKDIYPDPIKPPRTAATALASTKATLGDDIFADDKMDEDDLGEDLELDEDIDLYKNFIDDDMDGALNDDEPTAPKSAVYGNGYVKEMGTVQFLFASKPF